MKLRGVYTALITPFQADLSIDWDAFKRILDDQSEAGVSGVVICGTTAETSTLEENEKKELIQRALEHLKSTPLKVIAGSGSNSTKKTIDFSHWCEEQGTDGLLVVTPYYNKPTQEGLVAHFTAVADSLKKIPILLYNVPGRTGVSLSSTSIATLSQHSRITAIKEASGSLPLISEIFEKSKSSSPFQILSGDDITFLPALSLGACGVISVASHIIPRSLVALYAAFEQKDFQKALAIHNQFFPLFRDLFVETNPAPVKAALERLGVCRSSVRLPLVTLTQKSADMLFQTMNQCGVSSWKK